MQDSGSLAVFKVTARDQGHYKGPLGAFVTYCIISCFYFFSLMAGSGTSDQLNYIVKTCRKIIKFENFKLSQNRN